ncbi:MAG: 4Fe-4S double cluster binding domain-containing protein [Candidatus Bathyarchaeia archaeon]
MVSFDEELVVYTKNLSVDLFGVADLTPAKQYIENQGGKYVASFPKAVSLGIRLLDQVIDQLFNHNDLGTISIYCGLYTTVNAALDRAAFMVAKKIQGKGFQAYTIPASSMLNNGKLEATFSHKVAANLAGLGWIGKNCLLITPEYGPRVRLATVLTDAPLSTGSPIKNRCGDCTRCTDICPSKAILGRAFDSDELRDMRLNAELCDGYTEDRIKTFGDVNCGLCVYVCPHGNKKKHAQ